MSFTILGRKRAQAPMFFWSFAGCDVSESSNSTGVTSAGFWPLTTVLLFTLLTPYRKQLEEVRILF